MYDTDDYKAVVSKEEERKEFIKKTIQNEIFSTRGRKDWYQKHAMSFADHYIPEHPEMWEDFNLDQKKLIDDIEDYYYG